MTVEQKVKAAVSPLCEAFSVSVKKSNIGKEEYAVLVFSDERGTFFADGESQATETEIQLSFYFKNPDRKYCIKKTLLRNLRGLSFDIINTDQGYDEKTAYHYIIINASITTETEE